MPARLDALDARNRVAALALIALCLTGGAPATQAERVAGIDLVWLWRGPDGVESAEDADAPINPASTVKVATTLWTLRRLGPETRFATRFEPRGTVDPDSGALDGDLVVRGGGDPDFHVENAQAVARALHEAGIRSIRGDLVVGPGFWLGWEGGSERRLDDPAARAAQMGRRLADAWDPTRWTRGELRAVRRSLERRSGSGDRAGFVDLPVEGVRYDPTLGALDPVRESEAGPDGTVLHLSGPLRAILKRFNDYSNNDIERLRFHLGGDEAPAAMARELSRDWPADEPPPEFSTLSGLRRNRMTPRQVVRVLEELDAELAAAGLHPDDVLPVLGCGRSTLGNFPALGAAIQVGGLVAKTGTLVQTDGGVSALAGLLRGREGDAAFFVAAPRNGARMRRARNAQSAWLLERARGPAAPAARRLCPDGPLYPDTLARVRMAAESAP